jgi:uncharacterized protein YcfJ
MNKSMLAGLVAGIAVATAGGVAGYAFLGDRSAVEDTPLVEESVGTQPTAQAPAAQPSAPAQARPATPAAPPEECWDEEVTVQAEAKDRHAIAGTAAGAVIGGALAKELGDGNDLATAAGAAAGAFAGRRIQKNMQENNTTTTIERRCAPAGSR